MDTPEAGTKPRLSPWDALMFVLCAYVLVALFIDTAFQLPEATSEVLFLIDNILCIFFLADFGIHLYQAEHRWRYFFTWGWIDLLSSIPNLVFFRWGRAARIVRILRLLRGIRATRFLVAHLFEKRSRGVMFSLILICAVLAIFSSIAILNIETEEGANIKTPSDALWWAFVTVTTVGYGDRYPTTNEGRLLAALLMTAGIGLFGTFTAYVASIFMEPEEPSREPEIIALLQDISRRLDALEERLR